MPNQKGKTDSFADTTSLSYSKLRSAVQAMLPAAAAFGDDDNLIELGLDSLKIMRLVSKWRKSGACITFAQLIEAPCLGQWWKLMQNHDHQIVVASELPPEPTRSVVKRDPFSLTDVQYAYWIGRRSDQPLGGIGCHAYLELDGRDINLQRLESAWQAVLTYHPMLRTRFLTDGRQEVMDVPINETIIVHYWRFDPEEIVARKLNAVRDRLSHRRLAVERGEVTGLEISFLPGGRTRLHFDIDLLVADVQSFQIILRDLAASYGRGCPPPAPLQWDFAHYLEQETRRRAPEVQRAKQYWKGRLDTLPGAPGLPLKEKPEAIHSPIFKRRKHVIGNRDWERLRKRSTSNRITPAMVLLTAYAEILDRWSSTSQFLINIPLFDRQTGESGIEDVVADFTNLLLLAVDCRPGQSFLDRVRSIQAQFHQDVAYAAYSGVQVQRDMARVRQGERMLAPVVFASNLGTALINAECRETLGKLTYMISQTPQVWLDFQLYETEEGLLLAWDAVDALFPDGLVDQMFTACTRLIDWLAADDNDWRSAPDVLPASQQQRRDRDVEITLPQPTRCLHTSFFDWAAVHPQETALIDSRSNQHFSYGQLSEYALRVAAFLKEKGVTAGDPVAVTLPRGTEQIAAVFGVLAIGACYAPVSMTQPPARRDRIHKKAAIRYVLTDHEQAQTMDWPAGTAILDIAGAAGTTPLAGPVDISPERLAYIIFTSGSTGEPKGVEISHYGAWNTIADINRRYQVGPADRILAVSSLDFDLSVYDIFGLLSAGGSLVLITEETRRDAAHWLKLLNTYQVTIWNSVPVLLDMLLVVAESERQKTLPLRLALLSGDWIGLDLPSRLKSAAGHCHLVAMGGATEASIWSNFYDVTLPLPADWTSIPYGRPLASQAYRVVDGKGRDCPDWVAGELWIGGASVAQGYRGDPKLAAERFVSWKGARWYRTGDLGRFWPDGNIEFLGRKDFQVKIRGHRIELGEIETALKQHPGIRDAVVAAAGDPRRNKYLVGYVVPEQKKESSLFEMETTDPEMTKALWTALVNAGHRQAREALPREIEPEDFPVYWEYMEDLSVTHICRALEKAGAFLKPGEAYTLEALMHQCGIQPRYTELVRQWLGILESEGLLVKGETDAFTNTRMLSTEPFGTLKRGRAYPPWEKHSQGLLHYLQQIGQYSAELLKGDMDPLELFYSDALCLSPDDLMQTLPATDYRNSIAVRIIETVFQKLSGTEPIRVLEIGARCGNLTRSLLSLLRLDEAIYTCTDNSAFFINAAKNKFEHYSFVEYRLLDMDQNPQDQGYDAHSYDIIIASDALHRARNIETVLTHIQSLLAPGGLLLLLEMTRNSRLQHISTGFLEDGFTRFEDQRQTEHAPLLSVEKWQGVLQLKRFSEVAAFPEQGDPASVFGQHVILGFSFRRQSKSRDRLTHGHLPH